MSPRAITLWCMIAGSTVGSWLGSLIDHNFLFGLWSLGLGVIGALLGIYAGYRINRDM